MDWIPGQGTMIPNVNWQKKKKRGRRRKKRKFLELNKNENAAYQLEL